MTFELQVVRPDGHTLSRPLATPVAPRTRVGNLLDPSLDWWWGHRAVMDGEPAVVGDDDTLLDHLTATFDGAAEPWFARQGDG